MRLICLNTMYGLYGVAYKQKHWICDNKSTTDVFCFQEVLDNERGYIWTDHDESANRFEELKSELSDFWPFFAPRLYFATKTREGRKFNCATGLAMFVKKTADINAYRTAFVHGRLTATVEENRNWDNKPSNIQDVICTINDRKLHILNFHGLWDCKYGKEDTGDRIKQSANIAKIVREHWDSEECRILCGDFNLRPESMSFKMIEYEMHTIRYTNLIDKYDIKTTRTALYPKRKEEPYADYLFCDTRLNIDNFEVPEVDFSDHRPLILDFH